MSQLHFMNSITFNIAKFFFLLGNYDRNNNHDSLDYDKSMIRQIMTEITTMIHQIMTKAMIHQIMKEITTVIQKDNEINNHDLSNYYEITIMVHQIMSEITMIHQLMKEITTTIKKKDNEINNHD